MRRCIDLVDKSREQKPTDDEKKHRKGRVA